MAKVTIALTSITYAMKAKNILSAMKIKCEIIKTPKNLGSGCGYSIRATGDRDEIIRILEQNGIRHKECSDD